MTEPKRWPKHAEEARMEAIAEAQRGLQSLRQILEGNAKDITDVVRRVGQGADAFHQVIHTLQMAANHSKGE